MEGLYFESSATVPFHFLTVSECAKDPSNPVRGLVYGSSTSPTDFALGVKHMQMLGVSYLMLFSPQSKEMAADQPGLKLVSDRPRPRRRSRRTGGTSTRSSTRPASRRW